MTPYQREGEQIRCLRHSVLFDRTGECPGCAADPGPPLDPVPDEPLPSPPKGCLSLVDIERNLTEEAGEIRKLRRKLSAKRVKDLHAYNTIAKLADAWAKLMRAASELASRREDEVVVKRRERADRERQLGGAH